MLMRNHDIVPQDRIRGSDWLIAVTWAVKISLCYPAKCFRFLVLARKIFQVESAGACAVAFLKEIG